MNRIIRLACTIAVYVLGSLPPVWFIDLWVRNKRDVPLRNHIQSIVDQIPVGMAKSDVERVLQTHGLEDIFPRQQAYVEALGARVAENPRLMQRLRNEIAPQSTVVIDGAGAIFMQNVYILHIFYDQHDTVSEVVIEKTALGP